MKTRQIVKLALSMVVVAVLAFEQRAAESELQQPVRVVRHAAGDGESFRLADHAMSTLAAQSFSAQPAEAPDEPVFYLFPEQHRGTIPVMQFVNAEGRVHFATATVDVEEFRRRGLYELDRPLFIYERRVEGSSELFRLQNPATGSEFYTVDPEERLQRIAQGWESLPSLGWTQAIDSTGVGILKPTTIKLEMPELAALKAVRDFGRELTFGSSNEVIATLEPGSIVYAEKSDALPLGLVHRVDWVTTTSDGGLIVELSPVELMNAFDEVHLFLQDATLMFLGDERSGDWIAPDCGVDARKFADCRSPEANGVFDGTVRKDFIAEWKTKSKGLEGKITLSGGSAFGVMIEGQYSDSNACTANPVATFVISPYQEYKIAIEASGSLAKEKEKKLYTVQGTVPLGGIPLSGTFTLWAGYEASAGLSVKASFAETAQGTAVLRWDKAKKDLQTQICPKSCPSPFRCGPGSKPPSPPCTVTATISGEAAFQGTASVYLRPEIFLYVGAVGSGAGPYLDAKLQMQARTERYATSVYGQFIPSAGAKMKVGCWEVKAALTYNLPNGLEKRVASIPVAPKGVDASDGKIKGKVSISWNKVPDVSGYDIYRSTSLTGTKTKLNSKLLTSTKYDDSMKSTTKYYYWVRAVTEKMPGAYSNSDVGWAK